MARAVPLSFVAAIIAVLASLMAMPAFAHEDISAKPSFAPICHAATSLDTSIEEMAAARNGGAQWACSQQDWSAHTPVAWLLYDRDSWNGEERPRYFFSRIARFKTITFAALDADGTIRQLKWQESDAHPFPAGPVFELHLPEIKAETHAVLVRIERPHSIPLLTEARLTFDAENADWSLGQVLLLAFVMGMLVLPLFFDISFFVVLRERFVLLHAFMVLFMMGYVLFAGGLISEFALFPLKTIAIAGPLLWAFGVGIAALFLADFLEEGAQSKWMKRATIAAGIWTMVVPGFFALQLEWTQPVDDRLYFYTFMLTIVIITAAIAQAVIRGSSSARFIALAWAPIILASIERLMRGVGVYTGPSAFDQAMYLATGLEVIIMNLAIAARFLTIRRERDAALTEARMMETLSERDALTGLLNRRGLEDRFETLVSEGFDTFALIDLDRFKQVNDLYGHQIGDAALRACAKALKAPDDPNVVAARLGGEEFVVLMRGQQTLERIERMRQAISLHISRDVEGLNAPVTASSGAIELPRSLNRKMCFNEIYARADAMMYDAKASGRNRMVFEKLTVFPSPSIKAA